MDYVAVKALGWEPRGVNLALTRLRTPPGADPARRLLDWFRARQLRVTVKVSVDWMVTVSSMTTFTGDSLVSVLLCAATFAETGVARDNLPAILEALW